MDQGSNPHRGSRIALSSRREVLFQFFAARALYARAVAADSNKPILDQNGSQQNQDAQADATSQSKQHGHRQTRQSLEKARARRTRTAAFRQQTDAETPRRLKAFFLRMARSPGETEQDDDQRLDVPTATALRSSMGLVAFLPDRGRQEKPQAFQEGFLPLLGLARRSFLR